MVDRVFKSSKFTLYYSDRLSWKKSEFQTLIKYLGPTIEVLEKFMSGKGEGQLRLKSHVELQLTLCGDKKIRSLNKEYRGKDKATDVLSFPVHDSLRKGERDDQFLFDVLNIGDIIISRDVAKKQAKDFDISVPQEIVHLMVHGFLHLCGYDHELSKKEHELMFGIEQKLVAAIYKKLGLKGKVYSYGTES